MKRRRSTGPGLPRPIGSSPLDPSAMLTNEDLAALLPRVALGDRAAFERVYRATCAHLLGVAFRILNSRERAEEVLQEAFMNVWHSAGGFDASVAAPMTWLINIVRNKAIDALRSVFPERNASIALLRTILISHVIGAATEASNPPALCHTFMKASCNTSSARSLLFNIRKATPNRCAQVARYTRSNAARSPSATRGSRAARSSLVSMAEGSSGLEPIGRGKPGPVDRRRFIEQRAEFDSRDADFEADRQL